MEILNAAGGTASATHYFVCLDDADFFTGLPRLVTDPSLLSWILDTPVPDGRAVLTVVRGRIQHARPVS